MPVVHRRIIAEDPDPMTIPTELYCICRQSHANGFMICCDNCNEWFHGTCIGVTDEKGHTYDSFYCKRCRLRNSRLRCTFKSNPTNPAVPKEDPKEVHKPKTSRVINSAGVRQRPPITRRKSMFCSSTSHNLEMESALPEKSKAKTSAAVTKNPKRGSQVEVATNIDPNAIEAAKTTDPKSVEKTYETKETQCNLFRELATEATDDQYPPGKSGERGICFANTCTEKARPDSRYCSDECGNFTALTRVFSFAPHFVPAWALGCDGSRPKDLTVVNNSQHNMLTANESENEWENSHVSRESSQPTEVERKAESEAKRAKEDVRGKIDYFSRRKSRSSRYHSPKSVNNTDTRHSPAKKNRIQEDLTLAKTKNTKKSISEHKNADSESLQSSMTQPKENSKTTHSHRAEKRYLSRSSSEEPEIVPSRRSRLHSREINTKTPCASPKSSTKKYRFQEDLTLAKSKSSKNSIVEHKNADSESRQGSRTQTKENSKTSHSHRAEKRYLHCSSSEEPDIISSRRSRLHSSEKNTKTPCASPKSSKTSYNTSKTLPSSPNPFRNIPEQKTQSVKPFPSTATNKSYCQSKIANTQNNIPAKTIVDNVRKPSKPKNQNTSRTASPVPSPKRLKSKSGTANQENVAIYYEPKSESEKIKAISAIVSTLLPEQKACLARKRSLMKMAMEQQVTARRKSLRDIR